jgi:hypothetical protein
MVSNGVIWRATPGFVNDPRAGVAPQYHETDCKDATGYWGAILRAVPSWSFAPVTTDGVPLWVVIDTRRSGSDAPHLDLASSLGRRV